MQKEEIMKVHQKNKEERKQRRAMVDGPSNLNSLVDSKTQATVAVKRRALPSTSAQRKLCFYKAASQGAHDKVMQLLDHFNVTAGNHT